MNALHRLLPAFFVLLLAAGAAQAAPEQAAPKQPAPEQAALNGSYIEDYAGLFGAEAINAAHERIAELVEKTNVAVWVRTLKKLPDKTVKEIKSKKGVVAQEAVTFQIFARDRAEKDELKGIFILISNDPRFKRAVVVVNPEEMKTIFNDHQCDQVRKVLASRWFARQPDQTLLDAIDKVRNTIYNHSDATSISWPLIGAIIAGFLGLWLLLAVLRGRMMASGTGQSGDSQGRKNGQVAGLLGGMFGSVAGHWIYDSLFDHKKDTPAAPVVPGQNQTDRTLDLSEGEKKTEEHRPA